MVCRHLLGEKKGNYHVTSGCCVQPVTLHLACLRSLRESWTESSRLCSKSTSYCIQRGSRGQCKSVGSRGLCGRAAWTQLLPNVSRETEERGLLWPVWESSMDTRDPVLGRVQPSWYVGVKQQMQMLCLYFSVSITLPAKWRKINIFKTDKVMQKN